MPDGIPSYHYVTHRDTEEQAYRINEGKYSGIVWLYENVKFPMYNDEGGRISPEEAENIPLTFQIEVLYNPTDEDLTTGEFEKTVGDILLNIIEESLEHDQVEFRTDDTI
tara:strand:+ start:218 stop:547 length:330 start_codon:yes stop_codon:yes gene_type:complete